MNTNIRWQRVVATREGLSSWNESDTWIDKKFASSGLNKVVAGAPAAFKELTPGLVLNLRWRDFVRNRYLLPGGIEQAADPKWSNYIWNGPEGDWIKKLLSDPRVVNGDIAIQMLVADSASANSRTVPDCYISAGLAWAGTGTKSHHYRMRMDLEGGRAYMQAFYEALFKNYANAGFSAIQLGEYYTGPSSDYPEGFNKTKFFQGRRELWKHIDSIIPLAEDGTRIAVLQKNPINAGGVTFQDCIDANIGMSQSDIRGFEDLEMRYAFQNKMPTDIGGDTRFAKLWRDGSSRGASLVPTPAPANPFGWKAGQYVKFYPINIGWFASAIAPLDSLTLRMDETTEQNAKNMTEMLLAYGPGGTKLGPKNYPVPTTRPAYLPYGS